MPNYAVRRARVFLVLAGTFLGTLSLLNVLGISRFIDLSFVAFGVRVPMVVAVGVLPYPITFVCTDLLSELYGRKRATDVVLTGLCVNAWIAFLLWICGLLPGFEAVDPDTGELLRDAAGRLPAFFEVRELAFGVVAASLAAYLLAQWCDVRLFHFWKWLTRGRHLWLRNNASTLVSQAVDTSAIILIAHFLTGGLQSIDHGAPLWPQLFTLIASGYAFKLIVALVDTGPVYLLARWLRGFLGLGPHEELGPSGGTRRPSPGTAEATRRGQVG